MSEITLDVGLAFKIKQALSRNGIPDVADLDWLATGDNIVKIRQVRLGQAEIVATERRGKQRIASVSFERNEHGHIVLTLDGLDLTGAQEVRRLTAARFRLNEYVPLCLLSTRDNDYDENHRLIAGQRYKIALMPTREIERKSDRKIDALRRRGIEKYGYKKPLAGIVPRIRESVSDEKMKNMGFMYITAPHTAIKGSDGIPVVLGVSVRRFSDVPRISACWDDSDSLWNDDGAFAFFAPAN